MMCKGVFGQAEDGGDEQWQAPRQEPQRVRNALLEARALPKGAARCLGALARIAWAVRLVSCHIVSILIQ